MKVVRPSSEQLANTINPYVDPLECSLELAVEAKPGAAGLPELGTEKRPPFLHEKKGEVCRPPAILLNDKELSPGQLSPLSSRPPLVVGTNLGRQAAEAEEEEEEEEEKEMVPLKPSQCSHLTSQLKGPSLNGEVGRVTCTCTY